MTTDWTSAADLKAQLLRLWDRDELLGVEFPLQLRLRVPTSAALSERFDEVRDWVAELQQGSSKGYRLVLRDVRHRVIGNNCLPSEAWVDTLDDALRLASKVREGRALAELMSVTREQQPMLVPWLQCQPRRALALAGDWPQLMAIVAWLQAHPRPGLYLRQVDLPGIHSKFIEAQRAVLAELLDQVLPSEAVDGAARGAGQFAARYGFRDKPQRVRLRFLDPQHTAWVPGTDADYTISAPAFTRLNPPVRRVFITENEINFLAFPPVADSLVVFGAGYGFDALAQAAWLHQRALHYWGDIDTHGFAILDQLRATLPHARSLLMDQATLLAHQTLWGEESQPLLRDLPRLTPPEVALFNALRDKHWKTQLRLEQESISMAWVKQALYQVE